MNWLTRFPVLSGYFTRLVKGSRYIGVEVISMLFCIGI